MTVSTDPASVAIAVVGMAREGRFVDIEALFAPPLRAVVSAETLRVNWATESSRIGAITSVGQPATEPGAPGLVRVSVLVTGEHGGLTVIMSVDNTGTMHGLRLAPPSVTSWRPPAYADPKKLTEHDITLGSGPLAVPGTLTLPRGRGPWPGVVLLSGGGPFDRDATSGANKPFKDLAWGLAGRGVAVVRFDKVTFTHGDVFTRPGFTMADEYVPYALDAIRLLRRQPGVDPARMYAVGHSMGGSAAPRVAAAEPSLAGMVILAGDTVPLHQAAVRVARHLAAHNPGTDAQAAVDLITRQAARIGSPELSPATPTTDLLFGWPAPYWLDLRDYDRVATAAALDKPMLILQGGRDYQVTAADDLARWRAGLGDRHNVTIRVHDADDHMFFRGEGPSTPAGYDPPQHVDPAVVADIADWLTAGRRGIARLFPGRRR
jgi:dienelactone hydrolase